MAIVTFSDPLAAPAELEFTTFSMRCRSGVSAPQGEFTGLAQNAINFGGQWWEIGISVPPMERATFEPIWCWLLKMNNGELRTLLGDPAGATARGPALGTPLINGAGQSGNQIATDGWNNSQTPVLRQGDYLQIENRLYKVLDDANSNGSGQATLTIWPSLRTAPADNVAITKASAKSLFRQASPLDVDIDVALLYGLQLSFIEG